MKLKGFSPSTVLTMLLTMIVLVSIAFTINFTASTGASIKSKVEVEQDLYTMSNALDAGKLYLDTSLKYSTYQGAYDYGLEDKKDANLDSIASGVSKKIKDNLNVYSKGSYKFLSDKYLVSLPSYKTVDSAIYKIGNTITGLSISAEPSDRMKISVENQNEASVLEKSAGLDLDFPYPAIQIADQLSPEKLKQKTNSIISTKWPKTAKKEITGCKNKGQKIDTIDVFNEISKMNGLQASTNLQEAGKALQNYISSSISDSGKEFSNNLITIQISAENSVGNVQLAEPCTEKIEDNCSKPESTFSQVKECNFNYFYSGEAKITIRDGTKSYPVLATDLGESKVMFKNLIFKTTNSFASS